MDTWQHTGTFVMPYVKVMGLPEDLFRADTALACVVAFVLSASVFGPIGKSLGFAMLFVVVFLILKHMFIG
jgi:hypothetical protein